MAERIHYLDERKKGGISYIYHLVEVTQWAVDRWEYISPDAFITRMLHDSLEDHPEYWREILELIWFRFFRDVLVLATGGLRERKYRDEMILFFGNERDNRGKSDPEYDTLVDIVHILSPADPFYKAKNYSKYANFPESRTQEVQHIMTAISLYHSEIILPECREEAEMRLMNRIKKMNKDGEIITLDSTHSLLEELSNTPLSKEEKNERYEESYKKALIVANWPFLKRLTDKIISEDEEYIWLWNYLFFTEYNCKDKVEDMINNTKDLTEMEKSQPWYAQKRLIKAYILWVKLGNFGMAHEISLLVHAFWKHNRIMLQGVDVKKFTQRVASEEH